MRLTPVEIEHQKFNHGFRGYKEEEVDEFLDRLVADYEELYRENNELKEKTELLGSQLQSYRDIEESLKNTMLMAQKNSEELLANKQAEAELIIRNARLDAEKIINESQSQAKEVQEDLARFKQQREMFLLEYKTLLKSHLAYLEQGKLPPSQDASPEPSRESSRVD